MNSPRFTMLMRLERASLTNALSWDSVPSLPHKRYGDLEALAEKVLPLHKDRVANDPDYHFYNQQLTLNEKYRNIEQLSLNEAARKQLREEDRNARLELENQRRLAKGMEPLESLSNDNDEDEEVRAEEDEQKEEDPRADFFLTESANILLDGLLVTQGGKIERLAIN